MTGARKFLIAYNVNILGTKQQAHRIALNIRELGRGPGQVSPSLHTQTDRRTRTRTRTRTHTHTQRGRLKAVKALGWYLDEEDLAQVSINLTDFEITGMHVAFEECSKDAKVSAASVIRIVSDLIQYRA